MKKSAFTLVEILIVVAIIGILASLTTVALASIRAKSRDTKRLSDIKQFQSVLEIYRNDNNAYPRFATSGLPLVGPDGQTYMKQVPTAPGHPDGSCTTDSYIYDGSNNTVSYSLAYCLGGATQSAGPSNCLAGPGQICQSVAPTATAPTNIVLAVGSAQPVGGVTNVAIPAAGATDTTGAVTGWRTSTADKIKFTVTDGGSASSAITINSAAYTSGNDYTITAASNLTIVVTTSETGSTSATRTFTVSVASALAVIGDNLQGGKVAYILQVGDAGYDAGVQHGLIAMTSDTNVGGVQWGCYGTEMSGADATAIGSGNQNTIDIMAGCSTAGIAARLCGDLSSGGYSDWYLPSKLELGKLYVSRTQVGNYVNDVYWSSSEGDTLRQWLAWRLMFSDGNYYSNDKYFTTGNVRCIRSF